MTASAWEAIRPNIATLDDVHEWWQVIEGPITSLASPDDEAFFEQARVIAATLDWENDPWAQLVAALKASGDRKGKALFLPLRQALTGRDHGPEMAALLPLIGRTRALERLSTQQE